MAYLDFTSALYLGLRHPHQRLSPWDALTLGKPAALEEPAANGAVAQQLARLQGGQRGLLAPSTLHLFFDLCGMLARDRVAIYHDAGIYPIARWGIERAAALGAPVRSFPHHDGDALRRALLTGDKRLRPIVISDGACPGCGSVAPVPEYLALVRERGGLLVLDDTQALGILGHSPQVDEPYGRGGGGTLRWSGTGGPDLLVIASLAKGFGVPVAVLTGSLEMVAWFEARSETRVHCSPPSAALVRAAQDALRINAGKGDFLRRRLANLVRRFRTLLAQNGFSASGELFPVQTLRGVPGADCMALHEGLLRLGVKAVLHRPRAGTGALLSFLVSALHSPRELETAVSVLAEVSGNGAGLEGF